MKIIDIINHTKTPDFFENHHQKLLQIGVQGGFGFQGHGLARIVPLADKTLQVLIVCGKVFKEQKQGVIDVDAVYDDRGNIFAAVQSQIIQKLLQVFKGQKIHIVQPVDREFKVDIGLIGTDDVRKAPVLAYAVIDDAENNVVVHAVDCHEAVGHNPFHDFLLVAVLLALLNTVNDLQFIAGLEKVVFNPVFHSLLGILKFPVA